MNKYYFIKCEYKIEDEEIPVIYLWGRDLQTMEKFLFKIIGFEPYFYVLSSEKIPNIPQIKRTQKGLKSIFGEECIKIVCFRPEDVKDIRIQFQKTFESDVPFTRRFLINTGIRRYFTVPDGKTELNYTEIVGE